MYCDGAEEEYYERVDSGGVSTCTCGGGGGSQLTVYYCRPRGAAATRTHGQRAAGRRRRQHSMSAVAATAAITLTLHLLAFTLSAAAAVGATSQQQDLTDNCDWRGSGVSRGSRSGGAVQAVTLSCSSGSLYWGRRAAPSSGATAVRVLLQLTPRANLDFVGCLTLGGGASGDTYPEVAPLIYVGSGAGGKLEPVPVAEMSGTREKCFESRSGHLVVFLESKPGGERRHKEKTRRRRPAVSIEYHLQPLDEYKKLHSTPDAECKPCSDDELAMAYCTSDFVAEGQISHVYHNYHTGRSEVSVSASAVHRDASGGGGAAGPVFDWRAEHSAHRLTGTVHKPVRCGVRAPRDSPGLTFMLMGEVRAGGLPHLTCTPTLDQWRQVVQRVSKAGTQPCELE